MHAYNYYDHKAKETISHLAKYPKFLLLFITFLISYLIFNGRAYAPLHDAIIDVGYFGVFIAGVLFTYSFTSAPATMLLLILATHQNIYLAAFIGGLGALVGDIIIFTFIKSSFIDEIEKMSNENIVAYISHIIPNSIKKYVLPLIGCLIIASPFPDEIGVVLLASSKTISLKSFIWISYVMNTLGIFAILLVGSSI